MLSSDRCCVSGGRGQRAGVAWRAALARLVLCAPAVGRRAPLLARRARRPHLPAVRPRVRRHTRPLRAPRDTRDTRDPRAAGTARASAPTTRANTALSSVRKADMGSILY